MCLLKDKQHPKAGVVGWCEGAGKFLVLEHPTNLDNSRARAYLCLQLVRVGVAWTFFLSSIFSVFFHLLWEMS